MNYYLIWLQGQGDTYVKVVDDETWQWITNRNHSIPCPASVLERAKARRGEEFEAPFETSGSSYRNDRALYAPGIEVNGIVMDSCTDLSEAVLDIADWRRVLGIATFTDSFEGGIY